MGHNDLQDSELEGDGDLEVGGADVLPLVGLTGADGGTLLEALELDSVHVVPEAQPTPSRQHPPPRLAGQDDHPETQDKGVEGRGGFGVVGTTTTVVDVNEVLEEVVEGRTTTTDVPAITPTVH